MSSRYSCIAVFENDLFLGSYNEIPGQPTCTECEDGSILLFPGSDSADNCALCSPGTILIGVTPSLSQDISLFQPPNPAIHVLLASTIHCMVLFPALDALLVLLTMKRELLILNLVNLVLLAASAPPSINVKNVLLDSMQIQRLKTLVYLVLLAPFQENMGPPPALYALQELLMQQ